LPGLLKSLFRKPILQTYELEVPAVERSLGEIRDFITRTADEARFNVNETNNIKLALDEACSNVVRHAYKGMEPGMIRLRVDRREGELEVFIRDTGKGFEWKKSKTPDLNRYVEIGKRGGLGIWFIRKLMDETEYQTARGENLLRMIKRTREVTPLIAPAQLPETTLPVPFEAPGPPRKFSRVSVKYLLPVTGSVALIVAGIFAYMFINLAQNIRAEILSNTVELTRQLARDAENYLLKQDDLHLAAVVKTLVRTNPKLAYAFVVDKDNLIWAHSQTTRLFTQYVPLPGAPPVGREVVRQVLKDPRDGQVYEIAYPIFLGDMRLGTARVALKETAIAAEISLGRRGAVVMFFVVLVLSTAGAYLLMTVLVAPIRKLTDGMLAVSQGRTDHQIMIQSNDEFGQIARVFNDMTRRFNLAQRNLLEQERLQQEMQVAQEIQHTLLPRELPQIEGYEVSSMYRSAKEVGGDYFDFVWVDDNVLGIAVADVSGKGIPGSLVMTMIRTALRLEARNNHSATDVMAKVNSFVTRDMKKGMFVTMFYIILDSRRRIIQYTCAGHNPMILYREETDQIYYLKPRGFPVGIDLPNPDLFEKSLTQESVKLMKGDVLLLYTDGITEAMNPRREQFGEKRLLDLVRQHHELSAEEFVQKLSEDIARFTEDYPQNDDITCVAIKEKMMADDVQFNLRRKLFYLVERQGVPVREACRHLNVSPTTYYRLKQLRDKFGLKGLKETVMRKDAQMQQLSLEARKQILDVIVANPDFGPTRLLQAISEAGFDVEQLNEKMVYEELKRLRLATREERMAYSEKKKKVD
jgi:serine phosphatase RsbU (regulator of sigma subunit)/anti-sigma regulatory factor (Ser/Thr protein kinase)/transposase